MSGSRLGRGRGGRLAVYGGCGVVVILLVFLYRAATSEMARLRELHVQCAHQQEALAAQLQVIFEYKVRLEKSLAEEKSSNAAVKQELQQRASREKSLRDKDSIEAMQRFNSLQQTYKLLQTEHQDLQEECKKREKQALEDMGTLESTLKDLRSKMMQVKEEEHSLEHLKTKYLELETEKSKLEEKYNDLLKSTGNNNSTIDHLKKEVFQLKRELEEAKKSQRKATSPGPSVVSPQSGSQQVEQPALRGRNQNAVDDQKSALQQQVSSPNNEDANPRPLRQPEAHNAIGDNLSNEALNIDGMNEPQNNIGFAEKGLNIVPVGRNEQNEIQEVQRKPLPLPYDFKDKRKIQQEQDPDPPDKENHEEEQVQEDQDEEDDKKKVIPPPNNPVSNLNRKEPSRNDRKMEEKTGEDELLKLQSQKLGSSTTSKSVAGKEVSTKSSSMNPASASMDKTLASKPKAKLPVGVVPIPLLLEKQEDPGKHEEVEQSQAQKNNIPESKENDQMPDTGNLDPPFAAGQAARHVGDQILDRRPNPAWLRVAPGVQEIGDVLNQIGRLPEIYDGADDRQDAADENYDADYEKDPKKGDHHLGGGEDEAEDEEDQ